MDAGSPKARLRGCKHNGMLQSLSLCCAQPAPFTQGSQRLRSNVLSEPSLYNQCCRAVSTDSAARWSRLESCLSFLYYYITSLTTLNGIGPTGQGLCCRSLLKKGRSFDLPFFKDARRALVWGRTEPLFGFKTAFAARFLARARWGYAQGAALRTRPRGCSPWESPAGVTLGAAQTRQGTLGSLDSPSAAASSGGGQRTFRGHAGRCPDPPRNLRFLGFSFCCRVFGRWTADVQGSRWALPRPAKEP